MIEQGESSEALEVLKQTSYAPLKYGTLETARLRSKLAYDLVNKVSIKFGCSITWNSKSRFNIINRQPGLKSLFFRFHSNVFAAKNTPYPIVVILRVQRIRRLFSLGLTEREKQILSLKKDNMSDYEIARKLKVNTANATRSRKTALRKIERSQADLEFALQVGVKI